MKPLLITPHARSQALELELWWLQNRQKAPFLFNEELDAAFDLITQMPNAGKLWSKSTEPGVRRYLLKKTKYHVYYREEDDHIRVLAIWGGPREVGPDLGDNPF